MDASGKRGITYVVTNVSISVHVRPIAGHRPVDVGCGPITKGKASAQTVVVIVVMVCRFVKRVAVVMLVSDGGCSVQIVSELAVD